MFDLFLPTNWPAVLLVFAVMQICIFHGYAAFRTGKAITRRTVRVVNLACWLYIAVQIGAGMLAGLVFWLLAYALVHHFRTAQGFAS